MNPEEPVQDTDTEMKPERVGFEEELEESTEKNEAVTPQRLFFWLEHLVDWSLSREGLCRQLDFDDNDKLWSFLMLLRRLSTGGTSKPDIAVQGQTVALTIPPASVAGLGEQAFTFAARVDELV